MAFNMTEVSKNHGKSGMGASKELIEEMRKSDTKKEAKVSKEIDIGN